MSSEFISIAEEWVLVARIVHHKHLEFMALWKRVRLPHSSLTRKLAEFSELKRIFGVWWQWRFAIIRPIQLVLYAQKSLDKICIRDHVKQNPRKRSINRDERLIDGSSHTHTAVVWMGLIFYLIFCLCHDLFDWFIIGRRTISWSLLCD